MPRRKWRRYRVGGGVVTNYKDPLLLLNSKITCYRASGETRTLNPRIKSAVLHAIELQVQEAEGYEGEFTKTVCRLNRQPTANNVTTIQRTILATGAGFEPANYRTGVLRSFVVIMIDSFCWFSFANS